jgi:toxin ParE1/3/4
MAHRISPQAEADLDSVWLYVAKDSGSMDVATRLIDSISGRFVFLSGFPYAGRSRESDFGKGSRSFAAGEYVILYRIEDEDILILRVAHGRRLLEELFSR